MRSLSEPACKRVFGAVRTRIGARLALVALLAVGLGPGRTPARPKDPPIVETHRLRVTNQAGGSVEVSLDAGRSWEVLGHVTRPAAGRRGGGHALPGAAH